MLRQPNLYKRESYITLYNSVKIKNTSDFWLQPNDLWLLTARCNPLPLHQQIKTDKNGPIQFQTSCYRYCRN